MYQPSCSASHYDMNEKPAHRDARGLPPRIMIWMKNRHTEILGDCHRISKYRAYVRIYDSHFRFYLRMRCMWFFPSAIVTRIPSFGRMFVFSFLTFGTYVCYSFPFGYRDLDFSVWFSNVSATLPTLRLSCCPHSGFMASKSKSLKLRNTRKTAKERKTARAEAVVFTTNP